MKVSVIWFRRDLRLEDNTALYYALNSGYPVLPVFIYDNNIIEELPVDDARISFIYEKLEAIHNELLRFRSSLLCLKGRPSLVWKELIYKYKIHSVYVNKDYEPYAIQRDYQIQKILNGAGITFNAYKDQVIFETEEILKKDNRPYTVYTPYKTKWLEKLGKINLKTYPLSTNNFHRFNVTFPSIGELGFKMSSIKIRDYDLTHLDTYYLSKDFPSEDATSYLSSHLRFGTVSIRQIVKNLNPAYTVFLGELIWREFFMQILYHFPHVIDHNFKPKYDKIQWRNNSNEFEKWCRGQTGYPIVDAGMRQLNITGFMHNRVRMITAGFLCKHLLIDWKWGEAYFAGKLLDYELSSNNGNWQWVAGTGCDAVPYFRIFNPLKQQKKFDTDSLYIKKWVPEYNSASYVKPIVEHQYARKRAIEAYKAASK